MRTLEEKIADALRSNISAPNIYGMENAVAAISKLVPKREGPFLTEAREILHQYHLALDRREHGGIAQGNVVMKLEKLLGEPWQPGEALKKQNERNGR